MSGELYGEDAAGLLPPEFAILMVRDGGVSTVGICLRESAEGSASSMLW